MTSKKLYRYLNRLEKEISGVQLGSLRKVLKRLDMYQSQKLMTKSLANELRAAIKQELTRYVQEYKDNLFKMSVKAYKAGAATAMSDLGSTFHGVPKQAVKWLETVYKPLTDSTATNLMADTLRILQTATMLSIINGVSVYETTKLIKKLIWKRSKRQIQVAIRDRIGEAMQMGIWHTYRDNSDSIAGYIWAGPDDKRTTNYCKNRTIITQKKPLTEAEIKQLIKDNPRRYKGYEITAPYGTFLHPHIQCRHRLLAVTKKS